ncbi:MAG TPA: hypothetical protein VFI13_02140, partial [Gemmatimonadales bacterium]|nr:hypothetical protein [Gemmatimonadales bacterium]
ALPLVPFAEVDPHQRPLALESVHHSSVRPLKTSAIWYSPFSNRVSTGSTTSPIKGSTAP